jgi:hypothetical protein
MSDQLTEFLWAKLVEQLERNLQIERDLQDQVLDEDGWDESWTAEPEPPSLMQSAHDSVQPFFAELGFDVLVQEQETRGLNFSSTVCEMHIRERGHRNAEQMLVYRGESWGDAVVTAQKLIQQKEEELVELDEEETVPDSKDMEVLALSMVEERGPLSMRSATDQMQEEYGLDRKLIRDALERLVDRGDLYLDMNMDLALREEKPSGLKEAAKHAKKRTVVPPSAKNAVKTIHKTAETPEIDPSQLHAIHVQK